MTQRLTFCPFIRSEFSVDVLFPPALQGPCLAGLHLLGWGNLPFLNIDSCSVLHFQPPLILVSLLLQNLGGGYSTIFNRIKNLALPVIFQQDMGYKISGL